VKKCYVRILTQFRAEGKRFKSFVPEFEGISPAERLDNRRAEWIYLFNRKDFAGM